MSKALILVLPVVVMSLTGCGFSPDTPLTQAAARGDVAQVRSLIAGGADPNGMDSDGVTPLILAARAGEKSVVRALAEAHADPNLRDRRSNSWTPLVHAIHKNQTEAALALLEAGADPNARCGGRTTALIYAAAYGNTAMVRALLEKGADPYAQAEGGVTALWTAAGGGAVFDFTDGPSLGTCFPDTVRALLEKAPDMKLEKSFSTRLVKALGRSKECSELLARLERPGI